MFALDLANKSGHLATKLYFDTRHVVIRQLIKFSEKFTYLMLFFTLFRVIWLQLNLLLKHRIFMCHSLEVALEISDHLLRLALFFLPPLQFLLLVLGHLLSIDKLGFETQVLGLYMLLLPL